MRWGLRLTGRKGKAKTIYHMDISYAMDICPHDQRARLVLFYLLTQMSPNQPSAEISKLTLICHLSYWPASVLHSVAYQGSKFWHCTVKKAS